MTSANEHCRKNEDSTDLLGMVIFLVSVIFSFNNIIQIAALHITGGVNIYLHVCVDSLSGCTVCKIKAWQLVA